MTIGIEFQGGLNYFRKGILEKDENKKEIEKLVSIACAKEMQIKYIDTPSKTIENKKSTQAKTIKENKTEQNKSNNINSLDDLANLGIDINYIDE